MARPDLAELRRQIEMSSPVHGPGRIVKLDRQYAKALLKELEQDGNEHWPAEIARRIETAPRDTMTFINAAMAAARILRRMSRNTETRDDACPT
jgi:hypothetical protein